MSTVNRRRTVTKHARATTRKNPFGLTDGQCDVMDALVRYGTAKEAAHAKGTTHQTMNNVILDCCHKMGVRNYIHAAIKWDRFQRSEDQIRSLSLASTPNSVFALAANEQRRAA